MKEEASGKVMEVKRKRDRNMAIVLTLGNKVIQISGRQSVVRENI